jgi:hypothetical protein
VTFRSDAEIFAIREVAELWSRESGDPASLIERQLVEAALEFSSNAAAETDHPTGYHEFELLAARDQCMDSYGTEMDLLLGVAGLYVINWRWEISGESKTSRAALAAYCTNTNRKPPRFLGDNRQKSSAAAESACRTWLEKETKDSNPKPKDRMWNAAQKKFSRLSERGFDRAWKATVPSAWKRPGRRAKSEHL